MQLVAFAHVSNVLGTINPVAEMAARARAAGALTLVDGAQAVPQMPVDVSALGADFYAWTGHKALGPTGIGVLHGARELLEEMAPFLTGGDMIASVDFQRSTWNELPCEVRGGHADDRRGGRARRGRRLPVGARHGARARARARAHGATCSSASARCRALRVVGPPEAERRGGLASFTIEGMHPHDMAELVEPRGRVHPRRPPLRAAADALPRRGRHGARERRRVQRRSRTSTRWSSALPAAREVFGLLSMDDLYRDYILEHYKRPRNFGELEPHDLEALEHNPLCGDELGVHIRVKRRPHRGPALPRPRLRDLPGGGVDRLGGAEGHGARARSASSTRTG